MIHVQQIIRMAQWQELRAGTEPLLVLKHSTACGTSAEAHDRFHTWARNLPQVNLRLAEVRVVEERPISNQIASDTRTVHQSPQVLLIHHGEVLWRASHHAITEQALTRAVAAAGLLPGNTVS